MYDLSLRAVGDRGVVVRRLSERGALLCTAGSRSDPGRPDRRRAGLSSLAGDDKQRFPYSENLNRAKKSVALDLGRPEGRGLLQRLVRATGQFSPTSRQRVLSRSDILAAGRRILSPCA